MPADPNCVRCQGTGWREVQKGDLTAVERCDCSRATPPAERLSVSGIPDRFREVSFDGFRCKLPGDPNDYNALSMASIGVRQYADQYPFSERRGVFLQGPPGVGKTHLAVAALKRLMERGFQGRFFDYQTLLQKIRDGYNVASGASDRDAYRAALDAEILVLDDLGAHRATDWVYDTVTAIITHRYNENLATIVTTNLAMPESGDSTRYKDPATGQYRVKDTLAERIGERGVSRLFEMCAPIRIQTQDYRRRNLVRA